MNWRWERILQENSLCGRGGQARCYENKFVHETRIRNFALVCNYSVVLYFCEEN